VTDDPAPDELPAFDRETANALLAHAGRALRDALALHEQLRAALNRGELTEAQYLNDAIFVVLNDLAQRLELATKEAS
jgi:hypothetical protein